MKQPTKKEMLTYLRKRLGEGPKHDRVEPMSIKLHYEDGRIVVAETFWEDPDGGSIVVLSKYPLKLLKEIRRENE